MDQQVALEPDFSIGLMVEDRDRPASLLHRAEAIYLNEITDGFHARRVIRDWIDFYNAERPHTALGRRTPNEAYEGREPEKLAA